MFKFVSLQAEHSTQNIFPNPFARLLLACDTRAMKILFESATESQINISINFSVWLLISREKFGDVVTKFSCKSFNRDNFSATRTVRSFHICSKIYDINKAVQIRLKRETSKLLLRVCFHFREIFSDW